MSVSSWRFFFFFFSPSPSPPFFPLLERVSNDATSSFRDETNAAPRAGKGLLREQALRRGIFSAADGEDGPSVQVGYDTDYDAV